MTTKNYVRIAGIAFVSISTLAFLAVSFMAFHNPQSVMDLVSVSLQNNDAFSSIRGVYGGVGLSICIILIYLLKHNLKQALQLLAIIWGLYAVSRLMTIAIEGSLGAFGTQWLWIESLFFLLAIALQFRLKPSQS